LEPFFASEKTHSEETKKLIVPAKIVVNILIWSPSISNKTYATWVEIAVMTRQLNCRIRYFGKDSRTGSSDWKLHDLWKMYEIKAQAGYAIAEASRGRKPARLCNRRNNPKYTAAINVPTMINRKPDPGETVSFIVIKEENQTIEPWLLQPQQISLPDRLFFVSTLGGGQPIPRKFIKVMQTEWYRQHQ
jgi:hypothetical protein